MVDDQAVKERISPRTGKPLRKYRKGSVAVRGTTTVQHGESAASQTRRDTTEQKMAALSQARRKAIAAALVKGRRALRSLVGTVTDWHERSAEAGDLRDASDSKYRNACDAFYDAVVVPYWVAKNPKDPTSEGELDPTVRGFLAAEGIKQAAHATTQFTAAMKWMLGYHGKVKSKIKMGPRERTVVSRCSRIIAATLDLGTDDEELRPSDAIVRHGSINKLLAAWRKNTTGSEEPRPRLISALPDATKQFMLDGEAVERVLDRAERNDDEAAILNFLRIARDREWFERVAKNPS